MRNRKHQGRRKRNVLDNLNENVSCMGFIRELTLPDDWDGGVFARGTQQTVLLIQTRRIQYFHVLLRHSDQTVSGRGEKRRCYYRWQRRSEKIMYPSRSFRPLVSMDSSRCSILTIHFCGSPRVSLSIEPTRFRERSSMER